MDHERGFRRMVNFSDAIVAIAITLLILPLVDAAGAIGTASVDTFFRENDVKLLAFVLSFLVIGSFWLGQHQMLEGARSVNSVLVFGMGLWLFSIVFLPFPTELISSAHGGIATGHAVYIGTMLVTAVATLIQQWAIVHWPELQVHEGGRTPTIDAAVILAVLMAIALVATLVVPSFGLWPLLLLLLARPLERVAKVWRRRTPVD